jgi:hypothetical protein
MRQRCDNPKRNNYKNYGGRGIRVCKRWEKLENFESDMGERPPGATLERIDNSKGYEPSNCAWATKARQRRNSRRILSYTYQGKTQCLEDWSRELGIRYPTLYARIWEFGESFEQAIIPRRRRQRRV